MGDVVLVRPGERIGADGGGLIAVLGVRRPAPALGGAGHGGFTVVVGLNGLRLLRGAAWRRAMGSGARPAPPGRGR
ncbi:hypothetical protein C1J01_07700 [Nonomuraea aridisoli]|uniref:Uncharacterized protein n=1 Tax=Nonomuraea aridisoli TaxID=2070368 RepID=A0A2W2G299_9ACTN|nr:hypothetical protein C1J01_07700 [Nonomuraea aridisoli]